MPGERSLADHLESLAFENAFPSFKVMRERFGRPDVRFQVGIPAPIDLAVYSFGEAAFADPAILDACTVATAREIEKVFAHGGDEVVFQVETVIALVAARAPDRSRFGAHLCLGDFHHRAYGRMRDVRPLVLLANALAAQWPDGRVLEYVHAPFAAVTEPPIAEEAFYEPLSELALPEGTRFIAGFLHESLDTAAHRELLARIERLTGREVDVAAACGVGRRDSDEEAFDQMRETVALLEQPSASMA